MMAVGNGDGLIGVGVGKSLLARSAIKTAKLRASKRLEFFERLDNRTIYQDFYAEVNETQVFAQRATEGTGIQAHRVLRDVCQLVGLKDVKLRLSNSTRNTQAMVKAFLTGLRHQETFQQLSEREGLHVVEFNKENGYMPRVVASPSVQPLKDTVQPDQPLDLDELYGEGRVPLDREQRKPFFWSMTSFIHARWLQWPFRNQHKARVRLLADGEVPSWNTVTRRRWAEAKHASVLSGEATLPTGIGLHRVTREQLKEDE